YAYAVDGQRDACMGKFEDAKKILSMSTRTGYPESPVYWYDEGIIAIRESHCLLQLGHPREAAVRASEGLELYDTSRADSYAYARLGLSAAHLQCREIEESARVLSEAAELAARNRSARLVKEILATRIQMKTWGTTEAIKTLDEKLASYALA
ncbi:MAG: hypothetical protein ACRDRH_26795, partial [Pseudonocardia sp.]